MLTLSIQLPIFNMQLDMLHVLLDMLHVPVSIKQNINVTKNTCTFLLMVKFKNSIPSSRLVWQS